MHEFCCPGQQKNSAEVSTHKEMVAFDACYSASASSSSRAPPMTERFSEFINKQELADLGRGLIPAKCAKWALITFELWKNARNQAFLVTACLTSCFKAMTPVFLMYTLHVLLLRQENPLESTIHHPRSLHQLLCGLLRQMREINCPNFLDKKDVRFQQLQSFDVHLNKLHSTGIGRQVKHACRSHFKARGE